MTSKRKMDAGARFIRGLRNALVIMAAFWASVLLILGWLLPVEW
jgi:hypothetical protein